MLEFKRRFILALLVVFSVAPVAYFTYWAAPSVNLVIAPIATHSAQFAILDSSTGHTAQFCDALSYRLPTLQTLTQGQFLPLDYNTSDWMYDLDAILSLTHWPIEAAPTGCLELRNIFDFIVDPDLLYGFTAAFQVCSTRLIMLGFLNLELQLQQPLYGATEIFSSRNNCSYEGKLNTSKCLEDLNRAFLLSVVAQLNSSAESYYTAPLHRVMVVSALVQYAPNVSTIPNISLGVNGVSDKQPVLLPSAVNRKEAPLFSPPFIEKTFWAVVEDPFFLQFPPNVSISNVTIIPNLPTCNSTQSCTDAWYAHFRHNGLTVPLQVSPRFALNFNGTATGSTNPMIPSNFSQTDLVWQRFVDCWSVFVSHPSFFVRLGQALGVLSGVNAVLEIFIGPLVALWISM